MDLNKLIEYSTNIESIIGSGNCNKIDSAKSLLKSAISAIAKYKASAPDFLIPDVVTNIEKKLKQYKSQLDSLKKKCLEIKEELEKPHEDKQSEASTVSKVAFWSFLGLATAATGGIVYYIWRK